MNYKLRANSKGNAFFIVIFVLLLIGGALGYLIFKNTNRQSQNSSSQTSESLGEDAIGNDMSDNTSLPLGDNKYSTQEPKKGYIYSCEKIGGGGGAFNDGPWINNQNGTWSKKDKNVFVDGSVEWPNAKFLVSDSGSARELSGNGLPTNHATGKFPVDRSDDAYNYDRNPNSIKAQDLLKTIPLSPSIKETPSCLNMGPVGYSLNGVAIFNALDGEGRDAAAHEILDKCGGHPERTGEYHYHDYSECMSEKSTEPKLIGYMLDGFGLYKYPEDPSIEDLDECHGKIGEVSWNGAKQSIYHYVITAEYPYTLGCFRGK